MKNILTVRRFVPSDAGWFGSEKVVLRGWVQDLLTVATFALFVVPFVLLAFS